MMWRISLFLGMWVWIGCSSPATPPTGQPAPDGAAFQRVSAQFPLLVGTIESDSLPKASATALPPADALRWLDLNDSLRPAFPIARVEDSAWVALVYQWASDPTSPSTVATFFTRDGRRQGQIILKGLSDETAGHIAQVERFTWVGDSIGREMSLVDGSDAQRFTAAAHILPDGLLDQRATIDITLPKNQLPAYSYQMFTGASPSLALHVFSVVGQPEVYLLQHEANFRLLQRDPAGNRGDTLGIGGDPEVRGYLGKGYQQSAEGIRTRKSYLLVMQDGTPLELADVQTPLQPWAQWQSRYNRTGEPGTGRLQLAFRPDGRTATARLLVNSGPPSFRGCEVAGQIRLQGDIAFLRGQVVDSLPPCQVILVNVSRQVQAFAVSAPATCGCGGAASMNQTFSADVPTIASGE